ncbi:MSMEG_4193 family putative phosphomutase [Nocardioides sp. GY 10113]|nr:MSMEG_4193 family putative phosphomutase [Nocardioides sp. GY 10113]
MRHGRTTANAAGILAGRLPGVRLDDTGVAQAARAAERLAAVPLSVLVTSPQERCRQTAKAIAGAQREAGRQLRPVTDKAFAECDYGDWQGRPLKDLAKEQLWRTVQTQPSAAAFPAGESLVAMQQRAVAAVRRRDALVEAEHGPGAVWVAVSHGDIIKSVLADALGLHLDLFQRVHVDPASISVIRYAPDRPFVLGTNTHAGDLGWLAPATEEGAAAGHTSGSDAAVGGGAGPGTGPVESAP